jgi:hypothetical protein
VGPRSSVGAGIGGAESVSIVRVFRALAAYLLPRPLLSSPSSLISGSVPNVLFKRPVSATYLNNARNDFGDVRILVTSMFLPPMLLRRVCLAAWCERIICKELYEHSVRDTTVHTPAHRRHEMRFEAAGTLSGQRPQSLIE